MRYILVSFIMVIAVAGMMTPGLKPPLNLSDEAAHMLTFLACTLALLSIREIPKNYALVMMFLTAFLLEGAQFLVPARSPEIIDVICNLSGVLLATLIAATIASTKDFLSGN